MSEDGADHFTIYTDTYDESNVGNIEYDPSAMINNMPIISVDDVKFTYSASTGTYGSSVYDFNFEDTEGNTYTPQEFAALDVASLVIGQYTIVVTPLDTESENITGSYDLKFNLIRRTITADDVTTFTGSYVYTTYAMTFNELVVAVNGVILTRGSDYTVSSDSSQNVNVGTSKTLTITADSTYYTGTFGLTYEITKLNLDDIGTFVTLSDNVTSAGDTYIYTSKGIDVDLTITYAAYTASAGDYTITYYTDNLHTNALESAPVDVGTYYYIVVVDTTNIYGRANDYFVIDKRSIEDIDVSVPTFNPICEGMYKAQAITPDVEFASTYGEVTYTLAYANNVNAGTATITITGTGNYYGTRDVEFTISVLDLSLTNLIVPVSMSFTSSVYDTSSPESNLPVITINTIELDLANYDNDEFSISIEGREGTIGTYTLATYPGTVGVYRITITGQGDNVTGSRTCDFEIIGCELTEDFVTAYTSTYVYSNAVPSIAITLVNSNVTLVENTDYTVTPSDTYDAGTYTVTITGIGQYEGSFTKEYTITTYENAELTIETGETYTYTSKAIAITSDITWEYGTISYTDYTVTYYSDYNYTTAIDTPVNYGTYYYTISVNLKEQQRNLHLNLNQHMVLLHTQQHIQTM